MNVDLVAHKDGQTEEGMRWTLCGEVADAVRSIIHARKQHRPGQRESRDSKTANHHPGKRESNAIDPRP